MKEKRKFYCETAFVIGIVVLAFGTALMEKANFGVSMIVAPAYLIHLKVSQLLPFFSFGMSEYVFQAFLLILLAIVMRKVKKSYFLSFVTAVIYGLVLDVMVGLVNLLPFEGIAFRLILYIVGLLTCAFGVTLLLHSYFPPEAYELVVKEISQKYNKDMGKVKTIYDICSCILSIALTLIFFGKFIGVSWGTIVCAIFNGFLIGRIGRFLEKRFVFADILPLRDKLK